MSPGLLPVVWEPDGAEALVVTPRRTKSKMSDAGQWWLLVGDERGDG